MATGCLIKGFDILKAEFLRKVLTAKIGRFAKPRKCVRDLSGILNDLGECFGHETAIAAGFDDTDPDITTFGVFIGILIETDGADHFAGFFQNHGVVVICLKQITDGLVVVYTATEVTFFPIPQDQTGRFKLFHVITIEI